MYKHKLVSSLFVIITCCFLYSLTSCKKDKLLTSGGSISFSTDTLKFDTVFTSVGSVTRSFKLFNTNSKRIKIGNIKLAGGASSFFRMNVDGEPTKSIDNVELAPDDSLYIFVALTVDPNAALSPFVISDAVEVTLNGIQSSVQLQAYGQNAHYIVDSVMKSATWVNDKPYVIVHSALVDTLETLTIQKGCRIYMHQDSKLYVEGSLKVFGTKQDSVIFQGDRLDRDYFGYKDYPGEWRGLHFLSESNNNVINYTVIKNAGLTDAAIYMQPPNFFDINHPMLEMNNTIIENSAGFGILAYNSHVTANNCLIQSCGSQNLGVIQGGTYTFNNCTIATYGGLGINHAQEPTMVLLNYRDTSDQVGAYYENNLNANFTNCIIYGSLDDEIIFNKKGITGYTVNMDHCILKRTTTLNSALVTANNCILNQDPQFVDYSKWDYHTKSTSPAKGAGVFIPIIIDDLDGKSRANPPSIGCFESL